MLRRALTACLLIGALIAAPAATAGAGAAKIGVEDAWYPYAGIQNGKLAGFAVDIVRAAFQAAGQEIELQPMPYARCMRDTADGKLAACFNTSRDASLEKDFRFHARPLYSASILIFAEKKEPLVNVGISDLRGEAVAVTNGYTYSDDFDLDTTIRRSVVPKDESGLRQLAAGRVRYALVFDRVADFLLRSSASDIAGRIKTVGTLRTMDLYLSFGRRHPDTDHLIERFDLGLERIRRSGEYRRIDQRWSRGSP